MEYLLKLQRHTQPNIQTSLLAVARSDIGHEIFNEAVDSGYIRSKILEEN
jgi:coenzyme F420-reducing hydrogenase beta subunit